MNKIYALNEMLNFLQTNTSFKIKIKKDYLKADKKDDEKNSKSKEETNVGKMTISNKLCKGMRIVSYSITGFKTKLLYKVKK